MRATRNDGVGSLRGTVQRAELLDFLMRLARQFTTVLNKNSKAPVSDSMKDFFSAYVTPIVNNSRLMELRKTIRESARLNELLYDNHQGLKLLYQDAKNRMGKPDCVKFTIHVATELFMYYNNATYD